MIKALVIFGKEAVRRYDETGRVPSKKWLKDKGCAVDTKEFKTKAEYDAYSQGLNDADGWEETLAFPSAGTQEDCQGCNVWRSYFSDRQTKIFCPDCGKLILPDSPD